MNVKVGAVGEAGSTSRLKDCTFMVGKFIGDKFEGLKWMNSFVLNADHFSGGNHYCLPLMNVKIGAEQCTTNRLPGMPRKFPGQAPKC
jgi:hypothetical protein